MILVDDSVECADKWQDGTNSRKIKEMILDAGEKNGPEVHFPAIS